MRCKNTDVENINFLEKETLTSDCNPMIPETTDLGLYTHLGISKDYGRAAKKWGATITAGLYTFATLILSSGCTIGRGSEPRVNEGQVNHSMHKTEEVRLKSTETQKSGPSLSFETFWNHYLGEVETDYPSAKVNVSKDPEDFYYGWASYERCNLRPRHVSLKGINLIGAGVGLKHEFLEGRLTPSIEFGYFFPLAEIEGNWARGEDGWEPLAETHAFDLDLLYFHRDGVYFPEYEYNINGAFGGAVGMKLNIANWDKGKKKMNAKAGYRFLKLQDEIRGKDPDLPYCWITTKNRDLSTIFAGIEFEF